MPTSESQASKQATYRSDLPPGDESERTLEEWLSIYPTLILDAVDCAARRHLARVPRPTLDSHMMEETDLVQDCVLAVIQHPRHGTTRLPLPEAPALLGTFIARRCQSLSRAANVRERICSGLRDCVHAGRCGLPV